MWALGSIRKAGGVQERYSYCPADSTQSADLNSCCGILAREGVERCLSTPNAYKSERCTGNVLPRVSWASKNRIALADRWGECFKNGGAFSALARERRLVDHAISAISTGRGRRVRSKLQYTRNNLVYWIPIVGPNQAQDACDCVIRG